MDSRGLFVASLLDASARSLAAGVVNRLVDPTDPTAAGDFKSHLADVEARIAHLAESLAVGTSDLFVAHVEWLRNAYQAREVPLDVLDASLSSLRDELAESLGPDTHDAVFPQLDAAREVLRQTARKRRPFEDAGPHEELAQRFMLAQLEARREDALALVEEALDGGLSVSDLEVHVLGAAQTELGLMWQRGEIQIAEEHLGSGILEEALAVASHRIDTPLRRDRCALVAAVAGNLHDFGARVVSHHFRLEGWRTLFMGADLPSAEVVWATREHTPDVVALSVTLPLQIRATARVIEQLRAANLDAKILVGGPPFTAVPGLWKAVGADAGSMSVKDVAAEAERLLG